jgi:hypothetical protein
MTSARTATRLLVLVTALGVLSAPIAASAARPGASIVNRMRGRSAAATPATAPGAGRATSMLGRMRIGKARSAPGPNRTATLRAKQAEIKGKLANARENPLWAKSLVGAGNVVMVGMVAQFVFLPIAPGLVVPFLGVAGVMAVAAPVLGVVGAIVRVARESALKAIEAELDGEA